MGVKRFTSLGFLGTYRRHESWSTCLGDSLGSDPLEYLLCGKAFMGYDGGTVDHLLSQE